MQPDPPPPFNNTPPNPENRPPMQIPGGRNTTGIIADMILFFILAISMLSFNSYALQHRGFFNYKENWLLPINIIIDLLICLLFIVLYTFLMQSMLSPGFREFRFFDGMLLFKSFFVMIISLLFAYTTHTIYKQQEIALENERLKTENLQNRFDALTSQVNPHFFFNSLNSLSYLVRAKAFQKALSYIHGLSDVFRYVLQSNKKELVSLADEIRFLDSFIYLLKIRFENKLFFDVKIDPADFEKFKLPAISLQPVIENVVKHNKISSEHPMTISIFILKKEKLVISNPKQLKSDVEDSTSIGLENLDERCQLLLGKGIDIQISADKYQVALPLLLSKISVI